MASILVVWAGDGDMKAAEPGSIQQSRVHRVVEGEFFSTVMVLSDHTKKSARSFRKWLAGKVGVKVELDRRKLSSRYNLPEVYEATVEALEACTSRYEDEDIEFSFLLGADSPIMDAVLILLAHTRFSAELIHWTPQHGSKLLDMPSGDLLSLVQGSTSGTSLRRPTSELATLGAFVHKSKAMDAVIDRANRMTKVEVPVLIAGERGTGREFLARAIHKGSVRAGGPFVPVDCGALPEFDQEAALFGFDGKMGLLQKAHRGVVYLSGVEALTPSTQAMLFRTIREGRVMGLEDEDIPIDIRVIASTQVATTALVPTGKMLEELFHELAIGIIDVPPLRDRGADVELMVNFLLDGINAELGHKLTISSAALRRLKKHSWPGNVGELTAVIRRASVWAESEIDTEHVKSAILPVSPEGADDTVLNLELGGDFDIQRVLDGVSRHYVQRSLDETGGNKTKASRLLGFNNYQTLTNWMQRLGL